MRIGYNLAAYRANQSITDANRRVTSSIEKLSSGIRVAKAEDDAANYAISVKMRDQINGLKKSSNNAADAVSLLQTAEGTLNELHDMVQRMRELCIQGANETYTQDDLDKMQMELEELKDAFVSMTNQAEFNGIRLLNGNLDEYESSGERRALQIQIGTKQGMTMQININGFARSMPDIDDGGMPPVILREGYDLDKIVLDPVADPKAEASIEECDKIISYITKTRTQLGAYENRLEYVIKSLDANALHTEEAKSRIVDTDMSEEMTEYSTQQVILQAASSMLAQANALPQQLLQLLQ